MFYQYIMRSKDYFHWILYYSYVVNWKSLSPIQHQQEFPVRCLVRRETFSENSSIMKHLGYKTAQLKKWLSEVDQAKWLQCYSSMSSVTVSGRKHSIRWKMKVCSVEAEEKLAYIEESAYPRSLIGPFVCKWELQIYTDIGPNSTVLIVQNGR